jgi:alkanesulfonate monooxygenase SsuD/methylene tetrahydromethanopterin reductase-like flavin-dependent oxidoreductase (luciferase family)
MILGETDDAAEDALARRDRQAAFPVSAGLRDALLAADARNVAGERRPANVGGVLPISFCGGPDRVVEQLRRCREEIGAGVVDLSLQDPGTGDTGAMLRSLELFGEKVLPRIREF